MFTEIICLEREVEVRVPLKACLSPDLYASGRVSLQSGPAPPQLDLLPVSAQLLVRTLSVIGNDSAWRILPDPSAD